MTNPINKVSAIGIKGKNFDISLTGRTLLQGPNGSGKSALMEAVTVGILGFLPRTGKKLGETMKLASEEKMVINLSTRDFSWQRSFIETKKKSRVGDVSYSYTQKIHTTPPNPKMTERDKAGFLAGKLGHFSTMFDINEFTSMTDTQQRDFLFGLCSSIKNDWTKFSIEQKIRTSLEQGDYIPEIVEAAIKKVFAGWNDNLTIYENLNLLVDVAKSETSIANEIRTKNHAAKEQLVKKKNEVDGEETAYSLSELKAKKDDLIKQKSSLEESIRSANKEAAGIETLQNRESELKAKIASSPKEPLELLESELEELNESFTKHNKELDELRAEESEYNKKIDEAWKNLREVDRVETIKEMGVRIKEAEGRCPLMETQCPKEDELSSFKDKLAEEYKTNVLAVREAEEKVSSIKASTQDCKNRQRELMESINTTQAQINGTHTKITLVKTSREFISELASVQKQLEDNSSGFDIDNARKLLDANDIELREANAQINSAESRKSLLENVNDAKLKALQADQEYDVLSHFAILIGPKGIQGEFVELLSSPLSNIINKVLKRVKPEYEIYIDFQDKNGNEIFDIGWKSEDYKVTFSSLSGGERAIFGSAIIIGLVELFNPPLKVITLEAAELDSENIHSLLPALDKMGVHIDNIFVSTCHQVSHVEGWETIDMGNKAIKAPVKEMAAEETVVNTEEVYNSVNAEPSVQDYSGDDEPKSPEDEVEVPF